MVTGLENSGRREVFNVVTREISLRLFDFSELMKTHLDHGERLDTLSPSRRRIVQMQAFTQYLSKLGDGYSVLLGRLMVQTKYGLMAGLVDMENILAQLRICSWYIFVRDPMKIRELTTDANKRNALPEYEINPKLIDFEQAAEIAAATDMCRKWSIPLRLVDMELSDREPGYEEFWRDTINTITREIAELRNIDHF
jgi:hypothetical protein